MTQDQIRKVLAEIHTRIPKNLSKNVVSEVLATPTVLMVMEKALEMDSISPEKKAKIQTLMDSGEFSRKRVVENPQIVKLIDQFVSREINKAIKSGKLPPRSKLGELFKLNKNEKRTNRKKGKGDDRGLGDGLGSELHS